MKYDNLIAGDFTMVKSTVDIGGDQDLKMGCVLGRKTVSVFLGFKKSPYKI